MCERIELSEVLKVAGRMLSIPDLEDLVPFTYCKLFDKMNVSPSIYGGYKNEILVNYIDRWASSE